MDLIKAKAEAMNPLHSRRIQKLERSMEVCEWAKMTQDQFLIHLFAESADQSMNKITMEVLSGNNPTVAAFHTKVAKTENSLWYNADRNLGKYAGGQAPPTGARFCKPYNSSTHWESQCSST